MEVKDEMEHYDLIYNLRVMFWDVFATKTKEPQGKWSYVKIETIETKIKEVLLHNDPQKKYWYIVTPNGAEIYHTSVRTGPIRSVTMKKEDFDKTVAGNVTTMGPEQRVMSQISFMQRRSLEIAFFIRSVHDPDLENAQAESQQAKKEQKETLIQNYENRISTINLEEIPKAKMAVQRDSRLSDTEKKQLNILLTEKEVVLPDTTPTP